MMDAINQGAAAINNGVAYLKSNAWPIAFLLALWFVVKPRVIAAMDDAKTRRSPQQVKDYDSDLRRVRQLQQMQAEQDAKIKKKLLAEKKAAKILPEKKTEEEKKAKITTTVKPKTKPDAKLSMNSFSTPSYRPQRRTVRRG